MRLKLTTTFSPPGAAHVDVAYTLLSFIKGLPTVIVSVNAPVTSEMLQVSPLVLHIALVVFNTCVEYVN